MQSTYIILEYLGCKRTIVVVNKIKLANKINLNGDKQYLVVYKMLPWVWASWFTKKVTENEFGEMCEKWVELPTQRKHVAGEIVNNEYIMNK